MLVCKTPNCLGKVFHVNVNVHHVNYIILPAKVAAKDLSIKTSVQRTNLPHYYILVLLKGVILLLLLSSPSPKSQSPKSQSQDQKDLG